MAELRVWSAVIMAHHYHRACSEVGMYISGSETTEMGARKKKHFEKENRASARVHPHQHPPKLADPALFFRLFSAIIRHG